jgi:hypothetical protein
MLALGLIFLGGMAGARAQHPKAPQPAEVRDAQAQELARQRAQVRALELQRAQVEQELLQRMQLEQEVVRRAELAARGAVMVQPLWTDEQFERSVFQQDGTASRAHQRLDQQLAAQIVTIDRACNLTDAQKRKLQLAGRGDIKRFFDRYEGIKRKSQAVENDLQGVGDIQQDLNSLRTASQGELFHEDSLLIKSLPGTLTREQFAQYETVARERRATRHRSSIEQAITTLQRGMYMRDTQRRQLITLMTNETKPPRKSGPYDFYTLILQLGRLPEAKLKPLFDDAQWQIVNAQLERFKELEPTLKQSGQLADEDEADESKRP